MVQPMSSHWSAAAVSRLVAGAVSDWASVIDVKRRASNSFDITFDTGEVYRILVDELPAPIDGPREAE
jgi:hypothetical protein